MEHLVTIQTCPRRLENFDHQENLDSWEELHEWTRDLAKAEALVKEYTEKHGKQSSRFLPYWDSEDIIPKQCSYCGGLKPEDVLSLLSTGRWTVERTDKNYKLYFHTKAGIKRQEKLIQKMREGVDPLEAALDKVPAAFDPHLKIYLQHFTKEQIQEANRLLKEKT